MTTEVLLLGGPYDSVKVTLSGTPRRIQVGKRIYEQIVDPDTCEFLGAYVWVP